MKKIVFYHRFRFELIFMILISTILPSLFLYLIYADFIREIITEKYIESTMQSVLSTGENINYTLNGMVEFSNLILTNRDFIHVLNNNPVPGTGSFRSLLRSFFTSREDVAGIYVYTENDIYYVGAVKSNENISHPLKKIRDTGGEPVWLETTSTLINIFSGQFIRYYFSLGRKVIDFNTLKELGYLKIDIDESILEKSYKHLSVEPDIEVFIIDGYGQVISHRDKKLIGQSLNHLDYIIEILSSDSDNGYISFMEERGEMLSIYVLFNRNGWRLIKTVPKNYLYQELNSVQRMILLGLAGCFLIALIFVMFFSFKTTKPVINMMHLMKKAEEGELDVRIKDMSKDEIGLLGTSFNHMLEKMDILIKQLVEEERKKKEMEIEVLRAQINPHFLYNTLNTFKWMAKMRGDKSMSDAITALNKLLRASINLSRDMFPLKDEVEYIRNYILIQKLRFNERFTIEYYIAEDCLNCMLPKLILQPIVENSIIYGSDSERKASLVIVIRACRTGDALTISVTDNGPGIDEETLERIFCGEKNVNRLSKAGLNNVDQRIKLYFGNDYGVHIKTVINQGTCVSVIIPVRLKVTEDSENILL